MYDDPPLFARLLFFLLIVLAFSLVVLRSCKEDAEHDKYPLQVQITMQDGSVTNVTVPRNNVYHSSCGYVSVKLPDGSDIQTGNSNVTIIDREVKK